MSYTNHITVALSRLSTYRLANMADANCDVLDRPGARFLRGIRDEVIESLQFAGVEGPEDARRWSEGDAPGEIADGAVPVYNVDRWTVAGDLQAWAEDLSDFGPQSDIMKSVSLALYLIASRLVSALVEFVCELDEEPECECRHCGEPIHKDNDGAGGTVWCHEFGSTVCYDDPPGSLEAGADVTTAEPVDVE